MKTRRLAAFAAAASLAAVVFVSSASPANAWDKPMCERTWAAGKDHKDCDKFKTTTTKAKPTTTTTVKATTSTTKGPTTTVVVKPETKPAPVKVTPKYTG